jgi:hypothetical protein
VEVCSSRVLVLISLRLCACGEVDDDPVDVYFGNTSLKSLRLAVWSSLSLIHVFPLDLMSCVLYMSTILFWSRDIVKIDRAGMKLCKLCVALEQDIMLQVSSEYRWNMTAILGCLSWIRLV